MALSRSVSAENNRTTKERRTRPLRPRFSSAITSDLLPEAAERPSIQCSNSSGSRERISIFTEVGLKGKDETLDMALPASTDDEQQSRPAFNASVTSDRLEEAARMPIRLLRKASEVFERKSVFLEVGLEEGETPKPIPLQGEKTGPVRPRFDSTVTSDRLEEAARRPSAYSQLSSVSRQRTSAFVEVGLEEIVATEVLDASPERLPRRPAWQDAARDEPKSAARTKPRTNSGYWKSSSSSSPSASKIPAMRAESDASRATAALSTFSRVAGITLLIGVVLPNRASRNAGSTSPTGADAEIRREQ
ncbi:MAG: hypothetical protein M1818_005210 [Claussenomyces sp. TS43310]|nr:MAG: hypothetical protein M1818_005210 [Claussenomyces sp. TS43310]